MSSAARLVKSLGARLRNADPELVSLKVAARAAIVLPAVFLLADKIIGRSQTTIFAAFGSFAMLVLADFTGPWRPRLTAYLALAGVGAVFIALGTLCSRDALLGAAVMAVVAFAVLFSGVISRYVVAGTASALLTFILAVNVPAPDSSIPDRLGGWVLASAAGISAAMLLWPARPRAELRAAAAQACTALADLLAATLSGDAPMLDARAAAATEALTALRQRYDATLDAVGSGEAPALLVDELDWLHSVALSAAGESDGTSLLAEQQDREGMTEVIAALRASAARLSGGDERPALDRLEAVEESITEALVRELRELPAVPTEATLLSSLSPSLRVRELVGAASQVGTNVLAATSPREARLQRRRATSASTTRAVEEVASDHAVLRSAWFRNSVRGAAGLAVAVFVARQLSVQHSFWVALGTLSVLRSNALDTGSTVVRALAGTAVGIVVGVGFILLIGTEELVLWFVFPFAVFFAAYAARAISFAAGQAGFTVVVLILFDIVQPSGWTVGLVRVEDVAIGVAISVGVGLLFWPRGAGALLRTSLAEAYARSADYVSASVRALMRDDSTTTEPARIAARAAVRRLDDAFRQSSSERGVEGMHLQEFGALVAGATRLRLAAYSLAALAQTTNGTGRRCAGALYREADGLRSWYVALGDALTRSAPPPPPQHGAAEKARKRVLHCLRNALGDGDDAGLRATLGLVLASQHLVSLQSLEGHLVEVATELGTAEP